MIYTHIIIGVILYALSNAVIRLTSNTKKWTNSVLRTIAKKVVKSDDESVIRNSFFGPREYTQNRPPVFGFVEDFKDLYGTFKVLSIVSIVYPIVMSLEAIYTFWPAVIATIIGYGFYIGLNHVLKDYILSNDRENWVRIAMSVASIALATLFITQVNKQADSRMVSVYDKQLEAYQKQLDEAERYEAILQAKLVSSTIKQQELREAIDSLSTVRITNSKDYNDAMDFLKEFVNK